MIKSTEDGDLPADEIVRRMEMGIRRALNTPPTPTKELIGKSERAIARRDSRSPQEGEAETLGGEMKGHGGPSMLNVIVEGV